MFEIVERHREALGTWLTWTGAQRHVGDARRYAHYALVQAESGLAYDYAIRYRSALVGSIGLHGLDPAHRSAQMGYWLSPESERRGIVTRSARALTLHAFANLDLHRVEIRCVVENARSRAVAERLGFAFEGILRDAYVLHGAFRNIALYATTATTYERRPPMPPAT